MSDGKANAPARPGDVVDRYVAVTARVESWFARGFYWFAVLLALLAVAWTGLIVNQVARSGAWGDGLVPASVMLGIAAAVYLIAWGNRWLWSGRTDHLFGRKRFTAPGPLEDTRQKIVRIFVASPFARVP